MAKPGTIDAGEAFRLIDLIAPAPHGIASRVLAKTSGGNVTLFAFDAGEGFRTIINTGRVGHQEVYHVHMHVLGGPHLLGPMLQRSYQHGK